jgi:hypothetical protein
MVYGTNSGSGAMGVKNNAEFYADFETVEKIAINFLTKKF